MKGSVLLHTWRAAASLPRGKITLRFRTLVEFGNLHESAASGPFSKNMFVNNEEQDLFKLWIRNHSTIKKSDMKLDLKKRKIVLF